MDSASFFVDSLTFCVDLRTTRLYYLYHPYIIYSTSLNVLRLAFPPISVGF